MNQAFQKQLAEIRQELSNCKMCRHHWLEPHHVRSYDDLCGHHGLQVIRFLQENKLW